LSSAAQKSGVAVEIYESVDELADMLQQSLDDAEHEAGGWGSRARAVLDLAWRAACPKSSSPAPTLATHNIV